MTNGFDLYTSTRTVPSKTFVVPTTKKVTKKATFGENGHTVVTGSDHGQVYVFAINKTAHADIGTWGQGCHGSSSRGQVLYLLEQAGHSMSLNIFRQPL